MTTPQIVQEQPTLRRRVAATVASNLQALLFFAGVLWLSGQVVLPALIASGHVAVYIPITFGGAP